MACRTALFCSFHRYEEGLGGFWDNAISLMVIGLRYSEKLNYSDKRYRYCTIYRYLELKVQIRRIWGFWVHNALLRG